MTVTKQAVVEKLAGYLHHETSLAELVDWAENILMDGDLAEQDSEVVATVLARLGLADVRAFGLTWEDCEQFLDSLGYSTRVEVVPAHSTPSRAVVREKPPKKYDA